MKTIKTIQKGHKVQTGVGAGGLASTNHDAGGLRVKAGVRAGGISSNHNRAIIG